MVCAAAAAAADIIAPLPRSAARGNKRKGGEESDCAQPRHATIYGGGGRNRPRLGERGVEAVRNGSTFSLSLFIPTAGGRGGD